MLTTFFEINRRGNHTIHLLSEGITVENKQAVEEIIHRYNGEFRYYKVASELLEQCPIKENDHLTIATYYRLFMSERLPPTLDKVLYLDCDLVVNGSLYELWNIELEDNAVAAMEEMGGALPDAYERLSYDKQYGYFNAGVLLINLKYWREHKVVGLFNEYIAGNEVRLVAHDQDVLNALFHDKYLPLSCKWNVEETFYHYSFIERKAFDKGLLAILRHPVILHYTWKPKPWQPKCKHPLRINYFYYREKTIWRGLYRQKYLDALLHKYLFDVLSYFRIKNRKYYKLK